MRFRNIAIIKSSCGKNELNWLILSPNNIEGLTNLKFLLSGLTTTVYISVISILISMIIGFIVAVPSLAKSKYLTYLNIGYVEIVRAIPLLVLILWIYYGLPIMTGISFSPFVSGIIALSLSEDDEVFIPNIYPSDQLSIGACNGDFTLDEILINTRE